MCYRYTNPLLSCCRLSSEPNVIIIRKKEEMSSIIFKFFKNFSLLSPVAIGPGFWYSISRKGGNIPMDYGQMLPGVFVARPNRFIARVIIRGIEEICHVKNTGRCKELLPAGAKVWCRYDPNPDRKTHYDLIAVQKGDRLINMDSQAPNEAAYRWLLDGGLGDVEAVRREYTHGDSRFDLTFMKGGRRCFLEVKGVTLKEDNVARFPDAPTERGTKHLRGLIQAKADGYGAYVLFVIQMSGIHHFQPNDRTDPVFAQTLRQAKEAGVEILAVECQVEPGKITIAKSVPVELTPGSPIQPCSAAHP